MIINNNLSKSITDATFSEILRQLCYKSKYKHKYFYQCETYYPSSQECNRCGNIDKTYKKLDKRIYKCNNCGNKIDRDLNASINIMWEGVKLFIKEVY